MILYLIPQDQDPVMIDDMKQTIDEWNAKGGIGIKYQADEDSLDLVAKGLAHAYGK